MIEANNKKNNVNKGSNTGSKEKIINISKTCMVVSKVLYVLNCMATLAFLVLAIVLPTTKAIKSITPSECAIVFSVVTLYSFFLIDFLWNTTKFFESIYKEQSVFHCKITKYLKRIALSSLILSIIPALIGSILIHAIAPASEFVFRFEIVGIMTGIVLFFIALFFEHGATLQKQEDETL